MKPAKGALLAVLFFVAATAIMTYPLLPRAWNTLPFNIDPIFLSWTLDSELHQLLTKPLAFFDSTIFWPYHYTVAYSDLALPDLITFAPVELITGNPVLAFNVTLFTAIGGSGWGMYLLARRLLCSELPAIGAGVLFAFCSFRWGQYIHLQVMSTVWIPFSFLFLDRYLRGLPDAQRGAARRIRDAALAMLCFALQMLTSLYLGLFLAVELGLFLVLRQVPRASRLRPQECGWLAAAAAGACVLMAPFLWPFLEIERTLGFARGLQDAANGGAALSSFVRPAAGSLIYGRLLPLAQRMAGGSLTIQQETYFPGLVAIGLGAAGLVFGWRRGSRTFALLGAAGAVLSMGPLLLIHADRPTSIPLPYMGLFLAMPGFNSLRLPSRGAIFAFLGLALLVGAGLSWLGRRWPAAAPVALALLLLDNVAIPRPTVTLPVGKDIPAIYQWLAQQPDGVTVELPIAPSRYDESTYSTLAGYEYFSMYHRHPSVDGYSSFAPPLYFDLIDLTQTFPDRASVSFLRGESVRYAIVHGGDMTAVQLANLHQRLASFGDDLRLAGRWGTDEAYVLRPAAPAAVLPAASVTLPPAAQAGQPYRAVLQLEEPAEAAYLFQTAPSEAVDVAWGLGASQRFNLTLPLEYVQGVTNVPLDVPAPDQPGTHQLRVRSAGGPFQFDVEGQVQVSASPPAGAPLQLVSASLPGQTLAPGTEAFVQLTWTGAPNQRLTGFLHLLDAGGRTWSSTDGPAFGDQLGTERWLNGTITETAGLRLPASLPGGAFHVTVGWYDTATGQRVQWRNLGDQLVDEADVGAIQVGAAGPMPFVQTPLDAGGMVGANITPAGEPLKAGTPLGVVLFGAPTAPARLELRDQAGRVLASAPVAPGDGAQGTGEAPANAHAAGAVRPNALAAGGAGAKAAASGAADGAGGDVFRQLVNVPYPAWLRGSFEVALVVGQQSFDLGQVLVASPAPEAESTRVAVVTQPVTAAFRDLELAGASVEAGQATLMWHVSAPVPKSLTAFLHVLDASGNMLAQADGPPAGGLLPTTAWAPGTYVTDEHVLPDPLPAGAATLEVGLYDPATGQRWPLLAGGDAVRVPLPA